MSEVHAQGTKPAMAGAAALKDTLQAELLYEAHLQVSTSIPSAFPLPTGQTISRKRTEAGRLCITTSNGRRLLSTASQSAAPQDQSSAEGSGKQHAVRRSGSKPLILSIQQGPLTTAQAFHKAGHALDAAASSGLAVLELLHAMTQDGQLANGVSAILQAGAQSESIAHHQMSVAEELLRGLLRVAAIELPATKWDVVDVSSRDTYFTAQVMLLLIRCCPKITSLLQKCS